MVLVAVGRFEEAEQFFQEALDADPQVLGVGGPWTAERRGRYAELLSKAGRYEEAESSLLIALEIMRNRFGDRDERTQRMVNRFVKLYEAWGKPEKAAEYGALIEEQTNSNGQTKH